MEKPTMEVSEESLGNLDNEVKTMLQQLGQSAELVDAEDEDFEPVVHSPIVEVQPPLPMTSLETKICELYSVGKSTRAISEELGIQPHTVRSTLAKPHIKEFVNDLINAQYNTAIEGRLRLLHRIIDDKVEHIEREYDGDFANATKKDIVDLLVIADNMLKERQKKELGTNDNVYLNIVQQITGE